MKFGKKTAFAAILAAAALTVAGCSSSDPASSESSPAASGEPGQVSVIGFDNVPFSRYSRPALSTIAQDTMKAGRLMVSKLLDHGGAAAGRSERVPTELIVRETCGG